MAERLLTFKSGGWVLALSGVLCALAAVYVLIQPRHPGDGVHIDTYGFDLTHNLVPQEIIAAGFCKDGLPALVDPAMMTEPEAEKALESEHSTLLKSQDRIIGVFLHGDARAYPPSVMATHEVVNDTVGGVPIVVTYNPLCDSAVVLSRTVDDKTLTFGVSGLLFNSCLLMYDRQPDAKGESLWTPLGFKALAGPSAARMLKVLPCEVVTWSDWKTRHPDTKVLKPVRTINPEYARYFSNDELKFAVNPAWDTKVLPNKERIVAINAGAKWRVFVPSRLATLDPPAREKLLASINGVKLIFDPTGKTLRAESDLPDFEIAYAFVFAWYAQHPNESELLP